MKHVSKLVAAFALVAMTIALTGCEVPEDNSTFAEGKVKEAKVEAKEKAKDKGPKETVSQEQARKSAEAYLDTAAFSRSGLIDQLKFEGFSVKDATYGVDAQHADWNQQAAASAQQYLDTSSFSHQGLVDQLVFEGFTKPQAEFGVKKAGL